MEKRQKLRKQMWQDSYKIVDQGKYAFDINKGTHCSKVLTVQSFMFNHNIKIRISKNVYRRDSLKSCIVDFVPCFEFNRQVNHNKIL